MGGLRKYMPITWITSLLGSLALIGTPFFAGFYSKDSIIEAVAESHLPGAGFAHFAVLAGVFVTAFYSFRMYFLVFHGKERFDQNPDAHHDDHAHDTHAAHGHDAHAAHAAPAAHGHDDHGHGSKPHESPWVVWVPLVLLAIPSVIIGFMTIEPMLFGEFFKGAIIVDLEKHPGMEELAHAFHGPVAMAMHSLTSLPLWLAISGVVLSYYMYMINPALPAAIKKAVSPVYTLLENKYYLDWINENILARGARALGTGLWKGGDQMLIDGAVVNGSWKLVGLISGSVRKLQSGYLYHYALVMILGIFGFMSFFVTWPMVKQWLKL
jgi:NADH-quinone oxidoreductase subunit L